MKLFEYREARHAIEHALEGGQALHVWTPPSDGCGGSAWPGAPAMFRRFRLWAHLLDQDADRLRITAAALGLPRVAIGRRGARTQHLDLCGPALLAALQRCTPDVRVVAARREAAIVAPGWAMSGGADALAAASCGASPITGWKPVPPAPAGVVAAMLPALW